MTRKLSSFLIRWWRSDEDERLELEHIQSGHKRVARSIADAMAWMSDESAAHGDRDEPDEASTERLDGSAHAGNSPEPSSANHPRGKPGPRDGLAT